MLCYNETCTYNNGQCRCAKNSEVVLDDNGFCDDFKNYLNEAEYQNEFYMYCTKLKDGKAYKKCCYGAKRTLNGITFYYTDHFLRDKTPCTEEKTGLGFKYKKLFDPEAVNKIHEVISIGEINGVKISQLDDLEEL